MPAARSATRSSSTLRYISWNITLEASQIAADGRGSLVFHGAKQRQDFPAERRYARAAAALAPGGRVDDAPTVVPVERLDELPRATVRHAHRPRRGRNRPRFGDALDKLGLARPH